MENEEKKMCGCGNMPQMGCHGHHCCGKHHLVKMILKILIVVLIFWCGFNLGKIVGTIKGQYGHGFDKGNFEMMRGYNQDFAPTADTTPIAPAAKQ